jgi:hypothetical protein
MPTVMVFACPQVPVEVEKFLVLILSGLILPASFFRGLFPEVACLALDL